MQPRSRWIAALTLVPAFLAACSETPPTGVEPTTTGPLLQISDAVNSAGRAGFYFLPPMVPDPGPFTGTFDSNLSPEVRVCQLTGLACGTTIKTFTLTTTEPVEVSIPRQTYGVNWSTKNNPSSLATNAKYRIEIRVGTQLLGFADLAFVKSSKDVGSTPAGTVAAVLGSPLNIKFRVETRTVGSVSITPPTASIALPGTQAFSAEVRDLHGAVVPNASVTWASANAAAATVSPASGASTTATGVGVGNAIITAAAGGVTANAELTVNAGSPAAMSALSDDDQTATAGTAVAEPPSVRVTDEWGNPVAGVSVTFTSAPFGSVTGSPAITDVNGVATVGSWTLGTTTGFFPEREQRVTATAGELSATFLGRAVAGPPVSVTVLPYPFSRPSVTLDVGERATFQAIVNDVYGNAVYGHTVAFSSSDPEAVLMSSPRPAFPDGTSAVTLVDVQARLIAEDRSVEIRASVEGMPDIHGAYTVTVTKVLAPVAKADIIQFWPCGSFGCPYTPPGLPITVTTNVFLDHGFGPDDRGTPLAVITRFDVDPPGTPGAPASYPAGSTIFIYHGAGMSSEVTLLSDGTLTIKHTDPFVPESDGAFSATFFYELKNIGGSSIGAVTISRGSSGSGCPVTPPLGCFPALFELDRSRVAPAGGISVNTSALNVAGSKQAKTP